MAPPAVAPDKNQYNGLHGFAGVFGGEINLSPRIGCIIDENVALDLEYMENDTVLTRVTEARGARLPERIPISYMNKERSELVPVARSTYPAKNPAFLRSAWSG
jgi:hypothetical protein